MSTVEQLGDRWPKVLKGFDDAKLTSDDIKAITGAINSLTLEQAKAAVPMDFNSSSDGEMQARRHLYRAAHVLWSLAYRSDKSLPVVSWQTFGDLRSARDSLRKIVQDLVKKALGQDEAPISRVQSASNTITTQPTIVVRTQFNALKSFENAVKSVRAQVHTHRQQTVTPVQMAKRVLTPQMMVSTFQAQGQARQATAQTLLALSKEAVARQYFLKLLDIHSYFNDQRLKVLFNFTAMGLAIETAYKSFNKDVTEGQKATAAKLALAKTFFSALSKAPPPISFLGSIGGVVVGALHVDSEVDQRQVHTVLQGDGNPIVDALKGKFASIATTFEDKTRVGVALQGVSRASELQEALHIVAAKHFALIRDTVAEVCQDQFGGTSQAREAKFQVFLETLRRKRVSTLRGELTADALQGLAMVEADNLYKETVAAIDSTLQSAQIKTVPHDDLVGAVELMLYGSYVLNAFRRQGQTPGTYTYDYTATLPDTIVNRLASASTEWAVLAKNMTKEQAEAASRLKWEDRENHKRALCYFFEWFSSKMNPFLMVAGVAIEGKPVNAEYIKVQMMEYIDRLNKAIAANAKKAHVYSVRTTWNWSEIEYSIGRTQRVDVDALNLQLVSMRAEANFHRLQ